MTDRFAHPLRFLPVALDLRGRPCVVVGGGAVGTRKAVTLARAGGVVTVVAPVGSEALAQAAEGGTVRWLREPVRDDHLTGAFLVVAATDDAALNAGITRRAMGNGALACDASAGDASPVIFGALLERAEATIAVFTDGQAPARARDTRDAIAALLDAGGRGGRAP
jgi:siroheme synthase-like protein